VISFLENQIDAQNRQNFQIDEISQDHYNYCKYVEIRPDEENPDMIVVSVIANYQDDKDEEENIENRMIVEDQIKMFFDHFKNW
jgi:hypothetical protein